MTRPLYFVLGTRAQLIKVAPVMKELDRRQILYTSIYTGQHVETIEDLRSEFGLKPFDVILRRGKDEANTLPRFFKWAAESLFLVFRPKKIMKHGQGLVVTHGDTITSIWAAVLGKLGGSNVAHLESGLRSFNIFHPFPEELNRLIIFCLADYYFCPNNWAVQNLRSFKGEKINTNGNTLVDSIRLAIEHKQSFQIGPKPYCVVSMHRFENLHPKSALLKNIEIIEHVAKCLRTIFILHPVTLKRLEAAGLYSQLSGNPNIILEKRLGFFEFIKLLADSEFVVTDGGSNQEESSYLGLPCLLLRKRTERIEGLGENVVLSDYNIDKIDKFLSTYKSYRLASRIDSISPSSRIADYLSSID